MFSLFSRLDSRKLCSFILALVLLASKCDGFLNLHNNPHEIAHFASFTYTSTIEDSTIPDIVMSMTVQDSTKNNASFTSNYSGSFHQNPKKCQGVYIESPVHQSATPTQVESNRDRIDFHHDTEESLDGLAIQAFGDSIMQDAIMYHSVQDWISITNATFDTISVRNDATRASCGVVWIVIAITVFAFLLPTSFASRCPNDRFKMVASHHDSFQLNFIYKEGEMPEDLTFNRYYIAFGRDDKWTLTLVDPKIGDEFVSFKCKENQLGSVEIIAEKTLDTEYTHKDPICCAASYLLDWEDRKQDVDEEHESGLNGPHGQFPVMPRSFALDELKPLNYLPAGTAISRLPHEYQPVINQHFYYYHYMSPTSDGPTPKALVQNSGAFLKWAILQMTEDEFKRLSAWKPLSLTEQVFQSGNKKSRAAKVVGTSALLLLSGPAAPLFAGGMVYSVTRSRMSPQPRIYAPPGPLAFTIPQSVVLQQCSSSTACDTGIVNDLVVFKIECATWNSNDGVGWWDNVAQIKFAFSGDGIFNVETIALCPPKSIHFFSALDLYEAGHKPQYSSLVPKWELGSFCASCPSTSLTVQVSEKEALTNKRRIAHTLSVSGGIKGGAEAVEANVAVGYSYQRAKEAARSLVSGQATAIKASCNGFSLWHWKMDIGTWGAGQVVVPTHLFYCTDRDEKPVCTPKAVMKVFADPSAHSCNGHDIDADFGLPGDTGEWMSMHAGRPKPIRLQGQKSDNEPPFILQSMGPDQILHAENLRRAQPNVHHMRNRNKYNARSSTFGDRLHLDENNAKGKSLEDQYVGTTRFIEKAHHFGSQSGPKVKRSQGNEFSLLRRKHRK